MTDTDETKKITVDISEWELGEWPEDLWESVEVEKNNFCVSIEINYSIMREQARKVAKEAIETFLEDANWSLQAKGLVITDINGECPVTIPWEKLVFWKSEIEATQAELNKQKEQAENDDDDDVD